MLRPATPPWRLGDLLSLRRGLSLAHVGGQILLLHSGSGGMAAVEEDHALSLDLGAIVRLPALVRPRARFQPARHEHAAALAQVVGVGFRQAAPRDYLRPGRRLGLLLRQRARGPVW